MSYEYKREDVFDFAAAIRADTHIKGSELEFDFCPYCHGGRSRDRNTFAVNLDSGAFCCLRTSCGKSGHFVELARDFDYRLDFQEIKHYRKLPQKKFESRDSALEYMATRGISAEVCRKYSITARKDDPNIVVFPFYDDAGILRFVKYRQTRKNFKGSKEWCERDTMPILFGMRQCVDFGRLVITEGQIDSLSVAECGIDNAVSVPTGAQGFTWFANCADWLNQFRDIVVFGDCENGKITLVDALRARLDKPIKVVRQIDYLGEKDANAILTKYGKQAVITAVENAEILKLDNVKDLATVENVDLNQLQKIKTNITEVDRIIGGLVMGQVVLLTGKRGNGKSTFMSQLVCEALEQGETVFVYSGELADYHFKRWIDYQLAGPANVESRRNIFGDIEYSLSPQTVSSISQWYRGRAYIYDNDYIPEDEDELESLLETIEKVIARYGVRLVCIDNLMTAMEIVDDQNQLYMAQSRFVGRLKRIAKKFDITVLLVAHPRKSKEKFDNDDVSGSSDITNKVDVVMSYQRVEDEEHDAQLLITKNRLFGKYANGDSAIRMYFSPSSRRVYTQNADRHYGWEQDYTAEEELPL